MTKRYSDNIVVNIYSQISNILNYALVILGGILTGSLANSCNKKIKLLFFIILPSIIIRLTHSAKVTILLAFVNKGKPFFFQIRPELNEKLFRIVKFKTMTNQRGENGYLLPDSERMTKIGSLVRKASLDKLPQLWSVLKGDTSLIGRRPLLPEYLPLYNSEQKKRHTVKPGITVWAQVNVRNTISWKQKFEYDVWYVNNLSFRFA